MAATEPSKYITLVSSDGFEFVVLRKAAFISPAIRSMLDPKSQFSEARTGRCVFEEISSITYAPLATSVTDTDSKPSSPILGVAYYSGMVLEKVVEYFHYWYKNREREDVPDMDIPVELCLELLMAADFLGLDSKESTLPPQRSHSTI